MRYSNKLGSMPLVASPLPQNGPLRDVPLNPFRQEQGFSAEGFWWVYHPVFNAQGVMVDRPIPEQPAIDANSIEEYDAKYNALLSSPYVQYLDKPELLGYIWIDDGIGMPIDFRGKLKPTAPATRPAPVVPMPATQGGTVATVQNSLVNSSQPSIVPHDPSQQQVTPFAMPGVTTPNIDATPSGTSWLDKAKGLFSTLYPSNNGGVAPQNFTYTDANGNVVVDNGPFTESKMPLLIGAAFLGYLLLKRRR